MRLILTNMISWPRTIASQNALRRNDRENKKLPCKIVLQRCSATNNLQSFFSIFILGMQQLLLSSFLSLTLPSLPHFPGPDSPVGHTHRKAPHRQVRTEFPNHPPSPVRSINPKRRERASQGRSNKLISHGEMGKGGAQKGGGLLKERSKGEWKKQG